MAPTPQQAADALRERVGRAFERSAIIDGREIHVPLRELQILLTALETAPDRAVRLPDPTPEQFAGLTPLQKARATLHDYEATGLHQRTAHLVRTFAHAVALKLRASEEKRGYEDGWRTDAWESTCRRQLVLHVAKGDPLDVAAYAAFCWYRGWSTRPPTLEPGGPVEPGRLFLVGDL